MTRIVWNVQIQNESVECVSVDCGVSRLLWCHFLLTLTWLYLLIFSEIVTMTETNSDLLIGKTMEECNTILKSEDIKHKGNLCQLWRQVQTFLYNIYLKVTRFPSWEQLLLMVNPGWWPWTTERTGSTWSWRTTLSSRSSAILDCLLYDLHWIYIYIFNLIFCWNKPFPDCQCWILSCKCCSDPSDSWLKQIFEKIMIFI